MKAISIKQPWASFIASGKKTIETRTWETKYRGDILICSSKKPDENCEITSEKLKYGYAICVAELYKIEIMTEKHEEAAMCEVYPRAHAWHLRNIREIDPFPVKGMLRLFEVDYK